MISEFGCPSRMSCAPRQERVPHSRPSFGLEWGFSFVQTVTLFSQLEKDPARVEGSAVRRSGKKIGCPTHSRFSNVWETRNHPNHALRTRNVAGSASTSTGSHSFQRQE